MNTSLLNDIASMSRVFAHIKEAHKRECRRCELDPVHLGEKEVAVLSSLGFDVDDYQWTDEAGKVWTSNKVIRWHDKQMRVLRKITAPQSSC